MNCLQDKWRVASQEPLGIRCWDGVYVIYNPLSGRTHFLELLTGRVLEFIMSEMSSTDEILIVMSTFLDLDDKELVGREADKILRELEDAGLVQRVP